MGGSQLNDINWVRGLSAGFQQHSPPAPDEVYSKPLAGAGTHDFEEMDPPSESTGVKTGDSIFTEMESPTGNLGR